MRGLFETHQEKRALYVSLSQNVTVTHPYYQEGLE